MDTRTKEANGIGGFGIFVMMRPRIRALCLVISFNTSQAMKRDRVGAIVGVRG